MTMPTPRDEEEGKVPDEIIKDDKSRQPDKKSKIRRLNSASYQRGLTMLLDSKSDEYFVTADEFVGFKVFVHFLSLFVALLFVALLFVTFCRYFHAFLLVIFGFGVIL